MPISKKELMDRGTDIAKAERGFRQKQVMDYLKQNKSEGFTQGEIATALSTETQEVRPQAVRSAAIALMKRGEIDRRHVDGKFYFCVAAAPSKGK